MRRTFSRFFLLGLLILGISLPLVATAKETKDMTFTIQLSAEDKRDLKRVEDYFNALPPLTARFTQTSQQLDGKDFVAKGQFKLWRPGRLRIDYDAPNKDFVVADGRMIYQWDGQLRQQSQTSIGETLAGFILQKDLRFQGDDVTATGVTHPSKQKIDVSLRSVQQPEMGELTLTFDDTPLRLTGWRIKDGQGLTTSVALTDVQPNAPMNKKDFVFRNPDFGQRR